MLRKRLITLIVLIPAFAAMVAVGGWPFTLFMSLFLGVGGWEYWRLFRNGGYRPSLPLIIGGSLLLVGLRQVFGFTWSDLALAGLVLTGMIIHVFSYERGNQQAAVDLTITLGGILYLGWIGAYFISLRSTPDGQWWLLLALPAVWFADLGGYLVGRKWGRHKLAPLVSPNKSWEGYIGGIIMAAVATPLLAALWHLRAPAVTPLPALVLGTIIGILGPMGDLAESMLKRQFGVKDTSNILPGHGGVLDRIDSWLWAMVIGYYFVLFLK